MFTTSAEAPDGSCSESIPAIAHDLNNNMQMVLSSLDLMRCCLAQGRPADTAPYVERAVAFAERVAKLGRRLMRSRDCIDTRFAGVDMKSTIERIQPIISQITGVSVELSFSLADDLRPVSCDSLDFENALLNLVLNARDAMPAGGRLRWRRLDFSSIRRLFGRGHTPSLPSRIRASVWRPTPLAARSIPTLRLKRPDAALAWASRRLRRLRLRKVAASRPKASWARGPQSRSIFRSGPKKSLSRGFHATSTTSSPWSGEEGPWRASGRTSALRKLDFPGKRTELGNFANSTGGSVSNFSLFALKKFDFENISLYR